MRMSFNKTRVFQLMLFTVLCCFNYVFVFAKTIQSSSVQTATIENKFGFYLVRHKQITVTKIDGKEVDPNQKKHDLQAGKHTVHFGFYSGVANSHGGGTTTFSAQSPCRATFDAEGGHRYQVNGSMDGNSWKGWIEDKTTGKIVTNGVFIKNEQTEEKNTIKNEQLPPTLVEQPVSGKGNQLPTESLSNNNIQPVNKHNDEVTFLARFEKTDVDSLLYTVNGKVIWTSVGLLYIKHDENQIKFVSKPESKGINSQMEFHLKHNIETSRYLLSVFFKSSPILIDFPLSYDALTDELLGNSTHEDRIVEASIKKGKDKSYDWQVKIKGKDAKTSGVYAFCTKPLPK